MHWTRALAVDFRGNIELTAIVFFRLKQKRPSDSYRPARRIQYVAYSVTLLSIIRFSGMLCQSLQRLSESKTRWQNAAVKSLTVSSPGATRGKVSCIKTFHEIFGNANWIVTARTRSKHLAECSEC